MNHTLFAASPAELLASVLRESRIDSVLARDLDRRDWLAVAKRAGISLTDPAKLSAIAILERGERGRRA